jgi:hypothetical protein
MKTTPGKGILDRIMYSEWMERHFGDIKTGEHQGKNLYVDVLSRKIRLKYDPKELTAEFIAKK